jgi:soluble lytic murein transglycosylase-like protein
LKKSHLLIAAGLAALAAVLLLALFLTRQRPERHRLFRLGVGEERAQAPKAVPPVEQWSDLFQRLNSDDLATLLKAIERRHPGLYARYSLAYLHARTLIEANEIEAAAGKLAPFLAEGHPFRSLALYHQAEIEEERDDPRAASGQRQELIFSGAKVYREEAIDEEAAHLASFPDPSALTAFVRKVSPSIDTATRRRLNALVVEALLRQGNAAAAVAAGVSLLNAGTTDDASDRVSRALDRPEIVRGMSAGEKVLLGTAFQNHRRYDRAIALLGPVANSDDLRFAVGRCHFGAERFAQAQQVYLRGAAASSDPRMKSTFFFHASRAAQLQGNDQAAERLMTAAIAVRGNFRATSAALTQRIRTRVKQGRLAEAARDLQLLKRMAGNDRAFAEGSLAYAIGMLGAGNRAAALSALNGVPRSMLNAYDVPEFAYWRARAQEDSDPRAAFVAYLSVLRAGTPTHFAYFARDRLDSPALARRLEQELRSREAHAADLISAKNFTLAKEVETDRILLSSADRASELQRLARIYRELPEYRRILELKPDFLPRFPLQDTSSRAELLMAMGLYDEVVEEVRDRYSLREPASALTQAVALNRGSASRESIYAVEVLMRSVPEDYHPDLLPLVVRRLLYPRYFHSFIVRDAEKHGADPTLLLSIMREESRFNPRAKSAAAARGLLQFIITTAHDIGRDVGLVDLTPEDLYDPRVIIQLGAKYVAELSERFGGNRYQTAAAYNAGPAQVALWKRLAPAAGDDWFLSSINFEETKGYVRKVMNSYRRYQEIYGEGPPAGGLRLEP